jgi:MATE family multidrug resistance protein
LGFIGRIGKTELAAAALGNTVFYLVHYPMLGVMTAIDTLLATTFGAGQLKAYSDWTQVAMVALTALTVPVMVLMLFVEEMLAGIKQSPELAALAGSFCKQLVWGLPPYYWVQVMTKYLQSQHILGPPVYMGLVANAANVFLNWLLVFHLGYGFDGAPVATSLCRWFQLFLFMGYFVLWPQRHAATKPKSVMTRTKFMKCLPGFVKLAAPGAVMLLIEAWSFEITTILAGYLGTVELDAHLTMLQLATLAFLSLPFAVAISSTIRIGNLLGEGDAKVGLYKLNPVDPSLKRLVSTIEPMQ